MVLQYKGFIFALCFAMMMTQQNSFRFNLGKNEEECLFDYFPDKTLVIYEVNTSNMTIGVELKKSENKVVEAQKATIFK